MSAICFSRASSPSRRMNPASSPMRLMTARGSGSLLKKTFLTTPKVPRTFFIGNMMNRAEVEPPNATMAPGMSTKSLRLPCMVMAAKMKPQPRNMPRGVAKSIEKLLKINHENTKK